MPLLDLVSLMQILLVFCIGCVLGMQLISALLLIAWHVRMIIYSLNVHCSHSLLAHIRTVYPTCRKLNESFVCVRVFQVIDIYMQVLHSF